MDVRLAPCLLGIALASGCAERSAADAASDASAKIAASAPAASASGAVAASTGTAPRTRIAAFRRSFGGALEDVVRTVAIAPDGSVLVGGRCGNDVDFGGGKLATREFDREGFLARFDAKGVLAWTKRLGVDVFAVATDASGGVVVTGGFSGAVDLGGGALKAVDGGSMFVARFDSAGTHLWSKAFDAGGRSAAIDRDGNVFVAGVVHRTVDFGGGKLKSTIEPTTGPITNTFIVKLDPNGNHLWSKRYGSDLTYGPSLSLDAAGNLFVSGGTKGALDLGGGRLAPTRGWGLYLAKFGASGELRWSKLVSGVRSYSSGPSACDASGNVVLAGDFSQSFDAGGGPIRSAGGGVDVLLAKFDAEGRHLWSKALGGKGSDQVEQIDVSESGAIALTGSFDEPADFGGGALPGRGRLDAFVVKLGPDGGHLRSYALGGPASDGGVSVAFDGADSMLVAGRFAEKAQLAGGAALEAAGDSDLFLVSLSE